MEFSPNLTRELGYVDEPIGDLSGDPGSRAEPNEAWVYPESVDTVTNMLRNSKVAGARLALTMPVLDNRFRLSTKGIPEARLTALEIEIGLNKGDDDPLQPRRGPEFHTILEHMLMALDYGHSVFEVVYSKDSTPYAGQAPRPQGYAHWKQIAARMPWTITDWKVTPAGELLAVYQDVPVLADRGKLGSPTDAAMERRPQYTREKRRLDSMGGRALFVPTWSKKGGNWVGESIWRAVWGHYTLLGMLWKVSAQGAERQSMGLVKVGHDDTISPEAADLVAQNATGGAKAGVAYDKDHMEVALEGVKGSTVDPLPLIRYHGEEILNRILAGHLTLGHDNGARNLGDTLSKEFNEFVNQICTWLCTEFTEGLIRPWWAINFGPDEPYPRLVADEIVTNFDLSPTGLKMLVDSKLVLPDKPLRVELRRRAGYPEETQEDIKEITPLAGGSQRKGTNDLAPKPAAPPHRVAMSRSDLPEMESFDEWLDRVEEMLRGLRP